MSKHQAKTAPPPGTAPTSSARAEAGPFRTARLGALALMVTLLTSSCGGGGSGTSNPVSPPPPPGPSDANRSAAATATATGNALCSAIGAFYWEVGDVNTVRASGSVGTQSNGQPYTRDSVIDVASGSKLPFAAYVIQKYGDQASNVPYLNFTSGYSNFDNTQCVASQTVAQCNNGAINAAEAQAQIFHYQGGHMMQLAMNLGLGNDFIGQLTTEVLRQIGTDVAFNYVLPQPPGGLRTTAGNYAIFLRKLLVGSPSALALGPLLGSYAVCTHPSPTCSAAVQATDAIPEDLHYSLGHWVEDDPTTTPSSPVDNRAFSDAGKFGFYPWVDYARGLYGVVSRENQVQVANGQGYASLQCGRLIRYAWKTAQAQ